ncbi:unnamed protein product [Acanthoscelides obtectus]|uniref:Sphingomyelin phosphodiesterase C-terminal domain-containing protein n=1 Tax=Acanthoscelides obtectus TaxID=200917 RepID=A0A9P0MBV3_ACAOB|nr:unnamed protein product [Acanthoscelides obtectus]CAK1680313.1 Acid sphingomyelinase-like phosphodiesterase 3b [Acanthoscelides obtectus]
MVCRPPNSHNTHEVFLFQVYLVGHIAPGSNERHRGAYPPSHISYSDHHNKKYLKIVRRYASIIVGQFFGHLHSDTFRVIYGENGRPISWALLAPSITPKRNNDGPNNPGLRLYKFDKDTGQVFDYTQYYLDLSGAIANPNRNVEWSVEYNFSTYYSINDINAVNLHTLADKLTHHTPQENSIFSRYYRANSVRFNSGTAALAQCDSHCAHTHYCAITRVDYDEFHQCLQTAASALSASAATSAVAMRTIAKIVLVMWVIVR